MTLGEGREPVEVVLRFAGAEPAQPAGQEGGSYTPAIVSLSLGGVGLLLGAVTGAVAAVMASDIKKGCVDGHCLAADADRLRTARTLAKVSTAGFAVGGAGVLTGTILLFVRPGGGADAPSASLVVYGSF